MPKPPLPVMARAFESAGREGREEEGRSVANIANTVPILNVLATTLIATLYAHTCA